MKKATLFLSVFLCIITCFKANAQSYNKLEQNVTTNILGAQIPGIGIDYSIGANIDDTFYVGGGFGLGTWFDQKDEYYTDVWFPIFLQLRTTFLREQKFRPYISLSVGLDCLSIGAIINPNIGVAIKTTSSSLFYIGIGYNTYNIEHKLDKNTLESMFSAHLGVSF